MAKVIFTIDLILTLILLTHYYYPQLTSRGVNFFINLTFCMVTMVSQDDFSNKLTLSFYQVPINVSLLLFITQDSLFYYYRFES